MIVITIDQRASRRRPDLVDDLVARLNERYAPLRHFERTAGDELQGVLDDGVAAVELALDVAGTGEWAAARGADQDAALAAFAELAPVRRVPELAVAPEDASREVWARILRSPSSWRSPSWASRVSWATRRTRVLLRVFLH